MVLQHCFQKRIQDETNGSSDPQKDKTISITTGSTKTIRVKRIAIILEM